jgi:tRNA modification GTPase
MSDERQTMGERDTIFAVSTAPGRAAIAVVRVSGPEADQAILALTEEALPEARRAVLRTLYDKSNVRRIDDALVLRMRAPRSLRPRSFRAP